LKYTVTIDGREFEVQVDGDLVRLNGKVVPASLLRVPGTPMRQLLLGSQSHTYVMVDDGASWTVAKSGAATSVTVEDERTRQVRRLAGRADRAAAGGVVKAPMPGLVVRVEVNEGQEVSAGAGVVVLEAMKMENEISTPAGGVVTAVHVKAGQAVDKGAVLVEVAPEVGRYGGRAVGR
jgi:pyruvate carboxylase subunit B